MKFRKQLFYAPKYFVMPNKLADLISKIQRLYKKLNAKKITIEQIAVEIGYSREWLTIEKNSDIDKPFHYTIIGLLHHKFAYLLKNANDLIENNEPLILLIRDQQEQILHLTAVTKALVILVAEGFAPAGYLGADTKEKRLSKIQKRVDYELGKLLDEAKLKPVVEEIV